MAPKATSAATKTAAKPSSTGSKANPSAAAKKSVLQSNKGGKASGGKSKVGGAKKGVGAGKKATVPTWSPEQVAAGTKIQARARGFLARKHFKEEWARKGARDAEMEKLRQAAFMAEVQYERKMEAKRRKKQAEEAARKKKEAKLKREMLEAAFDGEVIELERMMGEAEGVMEESVDVADVHGNTLLSEAAAGGAAAAVALLLRRGAHPNSRGEFGRTPLWRAAFMGKVECVRPLLEGGADPRIGNETGELPEHVANAKVKEVLVGWDASATDGLVAKWEAAMQERVAARAHKKQEELKEAQDDLNQVTERHERAQKDLRCARVELERLIYEYDTMVGEQKAQSFIDVARQAIKDQEAKVEAVTTAAREAAEALQNARLEFREKNSGEAGDEDLPGLLVNLKELDDVLVKDVGDRVKSSGKWPAVIDVSGQASVFLRYMDTNYVNALNVNQVEPNKLRRSVLGAIRYGKPCVIDVMDVEMWDEVVKLFDVVEAGLLARILDKRILQSEAYLRLVRPSDGEEYEPNKFQDTRVRNFKFILLTSGRQPDSRITDAFYAIRIKVDK